jgi:hypothetical protein
MARTTNYSELRNLLLVVSFNQPTGEHGLDIQPVQVEARCEAVTTEGAVRNVSTKLNVGAVQDTKLTNKEIYTRVKAFNTPLANLLKDAILEALNEDISV